MHSSMFQSLRGFGVGWSRWNQVPHTLKNPVSIPERVWGGLEPSKMFAMMKLF